MSITRPHPFEKGRDGCTGILASEGAKELFCEPTSLRRGEGLVDRLHVVGLELWRRGQGGGGTVKMIVSMMGPGGRLRK